MAATLGSGQRNQERNPAMGQRGVRGLLANNDVMRMQLRAVLRAAAGTEGTAVLVPFVTSLSDLQRVKSAMLEERVAMKKAGVQCAADLALAPIIEVPAAAMSLASLLNDSDFAVVAIDDLQAHLLAADRDNAGVREYHEMVHPAVFEMLARMAKDAERREKPLILFGESAADPVRVPFYVGCGYRSFSIAPVRLRSVLRVLSRFSADECRRIAARILEAPRTLDVQKVLVGLDVS
jgi:phosphoenolpyruvate-protein kinase (PTS system EI component)